MRRLGRVDYAPTLAAMRRFADAHAPARADELWLLEHPPVYTLGQAGKPEHLLPAGQALGIALERIDRGGQITYHGPGQLVAYVLVDLARRRLKVRELVHLLEEAILQTLAGFGIAARRRDGAPGVYVDEAKIAALGLRIRNGCSYHGLAINVDMDLTPFDGINPCGHPGMATTQLRELGVHTTPEAVGERLATALIALLPPPHPPEP